MTTRQRVATLIEAGHSVREIASVLHISTQAVYKHLHGLGITPPTLRDADDNDKPEVPA